MRRHLTTTTLASALALGCGGGAAPTAEPATSPSPAPEEPGQPIELRGAAAEPAARAPVDERRLESLKAALGVAGLRLGDGVLRACPRVKPIAFDYDEARMVESFERNVIALGQCLAATPLAQVRVRLSFAGENGERGARALSELLSSMGVDATRFVTEPLREAAARPYVRVSLVRAP